ncbi:putative E3 ubiquitin ligase SUD1 [Drosera capensis]
MSEHLVLYVDRLMGNGEGKAENAMVLPMGGGEGTSSAVEVRGEDEAGGEVDALIQTVECRICQEEDGIKNLEVPCACSGSLKYAHRKCVQHWCNEKGDIICEICHQPYQSGYTASPRPTQPEDATIDIGGGWTISGTPLDMHDPRFLALAEAERQYLEAEYEEYAASSASGAAFFRSAALIVSLWSQLMAFLLVRHALTIPDADEDDDTPTFFSMFLLWAAGFLVPCYIMAWAISILQRRRQRQEAAALAASQVAFVLQSGRHRGLHFTITPRPHTAISQLPEETV